MALDPLSQAKTSAPVPIIRKGIRPASFVISIILFFLLGGTAGAFLMRQKDERDLAAFTESANREIDELKAKIAATKVIQYDVYFVKTENRKTELVASSRADLEAEKKEQQALEALLKGPTDKEKTQGLTTLVPAGTTLKEFSATSRTMTVTLSKEAGAVTNAEQKLLMKRQIEQTLKQFNTTVEVTIAIEGGQAL